MKVSSQCSRGLSRQAMCAFLLVLLLPACTSMPDLDPSPDTTSSLPADPKRAAAIAEMRAMAEAGDDLPYPEAFQQQQTARLSARGEPRSVGEVRAVEAELALIAERRAATRDAREIAELDARARELRRLALAAGEADLR